MLERLDAATPVERAVFESTGMEPGLDRAMMLPFAGSREEGNLQLAAPGFVYDAARAFVTPGMAARGQRVSDEDILNTAMNVMGGGAGASRVAGPRTAPDEMLLGMGVGSNVIKLGKTDGSNARNAADELKEIFAENPLNSRELISNTAGATVYSMGDTLHLSDIRTFAPGKGGASKMLRSILEVADKNNVPVTLTADSYSGDGLTTAQLVDWYKRNGFEVENDFGDDGVDMIRQPRNIAEEASGAARSTPTAADDLAELTAKAPTETVGNENLRRYNAWYENAIKRFEMESQAGDILDDLEVNETNIQGLSNEFWQNTFPLLNDSMQKRFIKYVKDLSGLDIGSSKTSQGDPVKSIEDLGFFLGEDLPSSADALEGIERGYVAMMAWANQQRLEAGAAMRDATPAALPGTARQTTAIGNEGTFDPANPVITKAKGGAVTKNNVERMRNDNRKYL
jgi:hypothetical protein